MIRLKPTNEAFNEATFYCTAYGLDWRKHIQPIYERGQVSGYNVLDSSFSTVKKTVRV